MRGLVLVDGGFIELSALPGRTWEQARVDMAPPDLTHLTFAEFLERARGGDAAQYWSPTVEATFRTSFKDGPDGKIRPSLRREDHLEILHALWEQHPSELFPRITVPTLIVPARRPNATGRAAEMAPVRAQLVANAAAALPNGRLSGWRTPSTTSRSSGRPSLPRRSSRWQAAVEPAAVRPAERDERRRGRMAQSWSRWSATSRWRRWCWPASLTRGGSSACRCRSWSGASSRCSALLRQDGRIAESYLPTILDVPAGVEELHRLLALEDGERVVFDLTNARGVLGFSLYELAHRYEDDGAGPFAGGAGGLERSARSARSARTATRSSRCGRRSAWPTTSRVHGKLLLGLERGQGSPSPFGKAAYRLASAIPQAQPILDATHRGRPDRPLRVQGRRALPLVEELVEDGVLAWRGSALFATSLRAFQFLHGRWLEEYLFEIADASGQFDDCASGVRFRWSFPGEERDSGPGDVANEIDFAGTAHGRATIASCKTGGHDVNGPLYELLTLAERAAGRSVISVFATTDTLDRSARRRAAALGVRTLDATRLPDPDLVLESLVHGVPTPTHPSARPPDKALRHGEMATGTDGIGVDGTDGGRWAGVARGMTGRQPRTPPRSRDSRERESRIGGQTCTAPSSRMSFSSTTTSRRSSRIRR